MTTSRSLSLAFALATLIGALVWHAKSVAQAPPGESIPSPVTNEAPKWFYRPQWQEIWAQANRAMPESKTRRKFIALSNASWTKDPVASDELEIAKGMALAKEDLVLSAERVFLQVAGRRLGSTQSQYALQLLSELASGAEPIDDEEIKSFALNSDVEVESEEAAAFIALYKWRALRDRGMKEWAEKIKAEIPDTSVWKLDLDYDRALSLVAKDEFDEALLVFNQLRDDPRLRLALKKRVELQIARIFFEKREYQAAIKIYQTLELPLRERGRVLLELAWSYFYLKNYSEALGILHSLKNPVFDSSRTPDRYILEMLILRDLCHYDKVERLESLFNAEYGPAFREIQARLDYPVQPRIASIALLENRMQVPANNVYRLRKERAQLETMDRGLLVESLKSYLRTREDSLRNSLERQIKTRAESVADNLIDQREQIKFLSYSSTIQSKSDGRHKPGYDGGDIPIANFETLYWPVRNNEFWWDEISFYRALIKSRCQETKGGP